MKSQTFAAAAAVLVVAAGCARQPKGIEVESVETWLRQNPEYMDGELRKLDWSYAASRVPLFGPNKATENTTWYFRTEKAEGLMHITARRVGDGELVITDIDTDLVRFTPPEE